MTRGAKKPATNPRKGCSPPWKVRHADAGALAAQAETQEQVKGDER